MVWFILFFIFVWLILYVFVIRPKLKEFRYTAGIYAELEQFEGSLWSKAALLVKGLKVAIVGLVTSAAPVVTFGYEQLSGFDWTKILPDEKARVAIGIVAALGVIGPIVMVALHQFAIADAAAAEPKT